MLLTNKEWPCILTTSTTSMLKNHLLQRPPKERSHPRHLQRQLSQNLSVELSLNQIAVRKLLNPVPLLRKRECRNLNLRFPLSLKRIRRSVWDQVLSQYKTDERKKKKSSLRHLIVPTATAVTTTTEMSHQLDHALAQKRLDIHALAQLL